MKRTITKNYKPGEIAIIETDSASTMFQIAASGSGGVLSVEAQPALSDDLWLPIIELSGDVEALKMDITTIDLITLNRPYSIRRFRFTPANGAETQPYTIDFSEWR